MVTRGERWSAGEAIFEFELSRLFDLRPGSSNEPLYTAVPRSITNKPMS